MEVLDEDTVGGRSQVECMHSGSRCIGRCGTLTLMCVKGMLDLVTYSRCSCSHSPSIYTCVPFADEEGLEPRPPVEESPSVFTRLEATRAELESQFGFNRFLEIYTQIQVLYIYMVVLAYIRVYCSNHSTTTILIPY